MSFSTYTTKSDKEIFSEFNVLPNAGLTQAEADQRLSQYGRNELESHEVRWWTILKRQFTSPFIYLLVGAALLAFILKERLDALMIIIFVAINAVLGFYQEFRSEKTIKLLKSYVVKRARVIREKKEQLIDSSLLVPGDLVIVEPGDIMPADLKFIEENDLTVDESILTGESAPVRKTEPPLKKTTNQIFEAANIGFSGTTVVSGKGIGLVIATGKLTAIGGIAETTVRTAHVGVFEKSLAKFSTFILRLIIITLIIIFIANWAIKGSSVNIIELVIFSIALAVSVIPEALPMVTTFSLSRGALHLAKNKVVVKRLASIEDLGSIEILCTDKTGTLTENVLTVDQFYAYQKQPVIFYASLASPFLNEKEGEPNNAFDVALFKKLARVEQKNLKSYAWLGEVPFDPDRRRNTVLVKKNSQTEMITRGAYENILPLCQKLKPADRAFITGWAAKAGLQGQRVIAVAGKKTRSTTRPENLEKEEKNLNFIGLVSFYDPLKKSTRQAINKAKELGVRVKILTGDSPEVAGAVAHKIGLIKSPDQVMTGNQLEKLSHEGQHAATEHYAIFARVAPEQKFKIIQLLQEKHEVGFLGEGINDAPALKIANVGLVVQHASDIARETADIVLLNRSLQVIMDGIQEGREVFANTLKYIKATLTSNFGNFFAVAIASLLIDYLPMLPLQLLLLNLLSDFPMIAIAADTVDPAELKRPRHYQVKDIALMAIVLGVVSTFFDFVFFAIFYRISPAVLQTNWFIASILTELILLFSIRTRFLFFRAKRAAPILFWLSGIAIAITLIIPFTSFGQSLFQFVRPMGLHLLIIVGVVIIYFVTTESVKLLYYKHVRGDELKGKTA